MIDAARTGRRLAFNVLLLDDKTLTPFDLCFFLDDSFEDLYGRPLLD
jgi:hypothetical protein